MLETPDDLVVGPTDHAANEYHITFENVTFSYHRNKTRKSAAARNSGTRDDSGADERQNTIEDISFALRKG